jgi:hypothetical protein
MHDTALLLVVAEQYPGRRIIRQAKSHLYGEIADCPILRGRTMSQLVFAQLNCSRRLSVHSGTLMEWEDRRPAVKRPAVTEASYPSPCCGRLARLKG